MPQIGIKLVKNLQFLGVKRKLVYKKLDTEKGEMGIAPIMPRLTICLFFFLGSCGLKKRMLPSNSN